MKYLFYLRRSLEFLLLYVFAIVVSGGSICLCIWVIVEYAQQQPFFYKILEVVAVIMPIIVTMVGFGVVLIEHFPNFFKYKTRK